MIKQIALTIDREGLSMRRNPDGTITGTARYAWHNSKRYTVRGLLNYFYNEELRKNTPPRERTTSRRWRAGTRRTKKYARATR